ncbi:MAG: metallophosphoesterase, partial [Erysipelotrichales bacterium]|nr:metallophosphoesterase [Erysipelotrichales bacterium]
MKILFMADREDKGLWEYYTQDKLKGIDVIVSCGDLDPRYLEFLETMTNVPLLYVRGNHDQI